MLNSNNAIYFSIIFANRNESIKSITKEIKCENFFTMTEARSLPNATTQKRPPDSRLPPNAKSARISF
jgi:hypothetical protein